ncbi:zonular occludens toxin domain-containing protein [Collimonas sp.]|jgi:zona occludens toxin|uniref:zonular occludens toxin domain-containing protein n=1 Tax=Collimonas sp. TaxID=1963772 RepID=UPI002CF741B3|nr:zonular occludens toxin domain-containing protein [Collimonas sp.]HWW06329.1 zonular occludens toxin domain-containing protein [Collimonas sp.]
MINLFTGLPGNGKTLYTLWYVKAWIEKENADREKAGEPAREIFYHGINNLMLPWTKIDPQKWMDCPPGSVIVIDESQFVFERKPNGSKLPIFYEQLAVHRHNGFDIVLITQNPSLVDNFVRKLVGRHMHIVRTFGMERAVVHEWAAVRESPEKPSSRKDSIKHHWRYPKEVYSYYKSAEQHTVKRTIPMKLFMLIFFVVALIVLVYVIYQRIQDSIHPERTQKGQVSASQTQSQQAAQGHVSYKNAQEDAKQFMFDRTPRVQGLPQTAPRYDDVVKPTTAPVPVACVSNQYRCDCFTQQATPINVPEVLCRDIVKRGYFVDFDDKGGNNRSQEAPLARGDIRANDRVEKVATVASSGSVSVLGDEEGYGVLGKRTGRSAGSR